MMRSRFHQGLTRLEVVVIVVLVGILFALSSTGSYSVADGMFELILSREGGSSVDITHRINVVPQQEDSVRQLFNEGVLQTIWRDVPDEENPYRIGGFPFSYRTDHAVGKRREIRKTIRRALLVEYSEGDQPPRYRLIPFQLPVSERCVELTIPREPPSDVEAWKPELRHPRETSSR